MNKKELSEQIGKINLKIVATEKELNKLALDYRRKKLELKQYRNNKADLKLKIQKIAIEEWEASHGGTKRSNQRTTMEKYSYDPNNEYYSQDKNISNNDGILNYITRNIVPYND